MAKLGAVNVVLKPILPNAAIRANDRLASGAAC